MSKSLGLSMMELRRKIDVRLDRIDFEKLSPKFIKYDYAIYNEKEVYLHNEIIEKDNRFLGNTSIEYNGKYIAIWHIDDVEVEDVDRLTSDIVHEMFHCHQHTLGEKRFYNDIDGLKYPCLLENYTMKHAELIALVKSYEADNLQEKNSFFNEYLYIREERSKLIGNHINYEKSIETIEGCAEFMANCALKILDKEKYTRKLKGTCEWLLDDGRKLFDTRHLAYYSGALLCEVVADLNKPVTYEIGADKPYIFDQISLEGKIGRKKDVDICHQELIRKSMIEYQSERSKKVESILLDSNICEYSGEYTIRGYDPMNMIRCENMVLHNSFLMIFDGEDTEFHKGPILIETDGKNFWDFKKYYCLEG